MMPRTRKKPPAPGGSRAARGSRGVGTLMNETSMLLPESAQRARGVENGHLRYTERWVDAGQVTRLTLAEEARQTSQQDHSLWTPNSKLRNNPVAFLSAGTSEPNKPEEACFVVPSDGRPGKQCSKTTTPGGRETHSLEGDKTDVIGPSWPEPDQIGIAQVRPGGDAPSFFVDLVGQNPRERAHNAFVGIPSRVPSPASSSGDEIILFRGRNRGTQSSGTAQVARTQAHTPILDVDGKRAMDTYILNVRSQLPAMAHTAEHSSRGPGRRHRRGRGRGQGHGNASDDSTLDDYISNMLENGEIESTPPQKPHSPGAQDGASADPRQSPSGVNDLGPGLWREGDHEKSESGAGNEASEKAEAQNPDNAHSSNYQAESSELDDEMLAKLFAGQSLEFELEIDRNNQHPSDSDSIDVWGHGPMPRRDEFDFMNWERPSLQRKKGKKSRAQLPLEEFDSDLEQQLQAAWQNDRLRKKQRKKQREEMRALGMLGHGTKPDDLRAKYPTGMSTTELAQELRSFLVSMRETVTFPPMDLHARKTIHELANQFKIKSKSAGKADQRRTTLFRTRTTMPYVESTFENAIGRVSRRQLHRPDSKKKRAPNKGATMGGGHAAASYRDGEIVGGEAAELGIENRGRAMLEKMGWSSGTALGAAHNKGILQPVTHTMKRSKTGLG